MTHAEAFVSEDAISGRVWTPDGGRTLYRRVGGVLEYKPYAIGAPSLDWCGLSAQVVAIKGSVVWADEAKVLTPAEALRALADGKCIDYTCGPVRLNSDGVFENFDDGKWTRCKIFGFHVGNNWRVVAEPPGGSEETKRQQRDHHGAFSPSECEPPAIYHERNCKGACVCWQVTI